MSHELLRLQESLYNVPHLVTQEQFEIVEQYLEKRNQGIALDSNSSGTKSEDTFGVKDGIGFLSIHGPLTYKPVVTLCGDGGTNYQGLYEEAEKLVNAGAKTIVLDVSSGGGEAYACFDYAMEVRRLATDNNVKLIAYVEKLAASAAYAWTCIADEIICNPQAEVGSIGVVVSLMNSNEAMKKEGYKRTFITAGASKVPFDGEGEFRKEFLDDLQAKVDALYVGFVDHVALNLGISEEAVKATEAKTFLPEKALEIGLIDKVMTDFEFNSYLDTLRQKKETGMFKKLFMNQDAVDVAAQTHEEEMKLQEMQAAHEAELAALKEQHEGQIDAIKADYDKQLIEAMQEAEDAQKALASLQEEVEAKRMQARKDALVEIHGEAAAEAQFEALKSLSDEHFAVVIAGSKASSAKEAQADQMLNELGASGEAESKSDEQDQAALVMKALKQQLNLQ